MNLEPDTIEENLKNLKYLFKGIQEFYKTKLFHDLADDEFRVYKAPTIEEIRRL